MVFFNAQVSNYSICDVGIWSYFYLQTAEMELQWLEEWQPVRKNASVGYVGRPGALVAAGGVQKDYQ